MADGASRTMVGSFSSIVAAPPSGRATAVVIDHERYAQKVMLQGKPIPWSDPVRYAQFMGQAQSLLRPDVTLLDLGAFYDFTLENDRAFATSLATRSRIGFALKTLLGETKVAGRAVELATVVAQTSRTSLVLTIPSPIVWLAKTHIAAGLGSVAALEPEHAENAAMYVADWLRRFAALPLAMVVLDERWTGLAWTFSVEDAAYVPVTNVVEHYRWNVGRRTEAGIRTLGSELHGASVPPRFWLSDDEPVPPGDFLVAEIPADAVPELVLERLGTLK